MFSFHISKALNAKGVGTASSLIQGIEGCISSGSKIISMSVGGGPDSSIFRQIYKDAYDEGVLIVAAAGNDGTTAHDYPASFPHVVSVGAVDKKGVSKASFSNYNDQIEIMVSLQIAAIVQFHHSHITVDAHCRLQALMS